MEHSGIRVSDGEWIAPGFRCVSSRLRVEFGYFKKNMDNQEVKIQITRQPGLLPIVQGFPKMVLPAANIYLHKPEMKVDWLTTVAQQDSISQGLIVAFVSRHHRLAKIVSWYVIPEHAGRGLGQQLIAGLEAWCLSQGIENMTLELRDSNASYPVASHILQKQGWNQQQPLVHRFKVAAETLRNLEWDRYRRKPSGLEVTPWKSISNRQYTELLERWRHDDQFRRELLPLSGEKGIDKALSLGLCQREKVIGWLMAVRIRSDLIEYSSLYVEPEYRSSGATIMLLGESFLRLADSRIENVIFQVKVENDLMLRFVRKRFDPILSEATLYRSEKSLTD